VSFGLSDCAQAIVSAALLAGILVLYLHRFARAQRWLPIALAVCLIDQILKVYVVSNQFDRRGLSLFHGAIQITYLQNRELGFGGGLSYLLLLTTLCVLALLFLYYRLDRMKYRMSRLAEVGFAIMIGGYLGILVDRVMLGSVIDFIEFGRNGAFVYNLADLAVIAALGLLCVRAVRFLSEPFDWERVPLEGVVREGRS
jgi:signal peptidase II